MATKTKAKKGKTAVTVKVKLKKAAANGGEKGNSSTAKLTALICEDLDADYDAVDKAAKKKGLDLGPVTMYAVFNRVHLAVRALRAAGKMK